MSPGWVRALWGHEGGAVVPTVALSLTALIAAGGIAFDYARMAGLDTELQNAADQAALAAATQLDGKERAMERAAAAALDLIGNDARFANDGDGLDVDIDPALTFYATKADAEAGTNPIGVDEVTRFAEAHFVRVLVFPREAFYALTPIVDVIRSGDLNAEAVAGLGSAICKVPPVMMCNPAEPATNTDVNFGFSPAAGVGLRLVIGDPAAPGNFGFLQTGETGGAKEVAKTLGYDIPPNGCISTNGVTTEPGNMISVRAAFNTRFDIYENGGTTCPDGGVCSPSRNSRKDLVRGSSCGLTTNTSQPDWHEALIPYRGRADQLPLSPATPMDATNTYPETMGYPRDLCHATSVLGSCAGDVVGNGAWDRDAYFQVNYGWGTIWQSQTGLPPNASRYDVYKWEMDNAATTIDGPKPVSGGFTSYSAPICKAPGITPDLTTPDRRRLSVAVVNCHAQDLKGKETNVQVVKWLDVFLVEPAIARGSGPSQRTRNGDIYVEVIEETTSGGSGTVGAQAVRRDVPYLVK